MIESRQTKTKVANLNSSPAPEDPKKNIDSLGDRGLRYMLSRNCWVRNFRTSRHHLCSLQNRRQLLSVRRVSCNVTRTQEEILDGKFKLIAQLELLMGVYEDERAKFQGNGVALLGKWLALEP